MQPSPASALAGLVLCSALSARLIAQPTVAARVQVENEVFDAGRGTISFDIVNHTAAAVTAFTYEIRFSRRSGEELSSQRSEDFAGVAGMAAAVPGDLSVKVPEGFLPIPPRGGRTVTEELRGPYAERESADPIVSATATVVGALLSDGSTVGGADRVRRLKQSRADRVDKLGAYVAALRHADDASDGADVLNALSVEADQQPDVRDWLLRLRAELEHLPGDIHQRLRDVIEMIEAQRDDAIRGGSKFAR